MSYQEERGMTLNGGNWNGVEVVHHSQRTSGSSLTTSTSRASTSSGGISAQEARWLYMEKESLSQQLISAQKKIAKQNKQLRDTQDLLRELSQSPDALLIKKLEKTVEHERRERLKTEKELKKMQNDFKSFAGKYFVVKDKEDLVEGEQEQQNGSSDNEEDVVPSSQLVNNGTAREHVEMQQQHEYEDSGSILPVDADGDSGIDGNSEMDGNGYVYQNSDIDRNGYLYENSDINGNGYVEENSDIDMNDDVDGNNYASWESSSLSPPPDPDYVVISDDDDHDEEISVISQSEHLAGAQLNENEERGVEPPKPAKRARMTDVKHGYDPEKLELGVFGCICSKEFKAKKNLKSHIVYSTKERTVPCYICGKMFLSNSFLKPHLRQSHKIVVESAQGQLTRQVGGSRVYQQKTSKKKSVHFQVSSSPSDKYACHCENEYTRMSDLKEHIAKNNKKAGRSAYKSKQR